MRGKSTHQQVMAVLPKPGLTSCAGKFEGRYASTGGFGSFTMTFRSGKAAMTDVGGNDEVFECWMGGGRMYLHKPDAPDLDIPIDINDDGTPDGAECRTRRGSAFPHETGSRSPGAERLS